jgi:hypothetical protein
VAIDLSTVKSRILSELNFKNPKPAMSVDGLLVGENGVSVDLKKIEEKIR